MAGVEVIFDGATGGLSTFDLHYEVWDNGTMQAEGTITGLVAPKGPAQLSVEILPLVGGLPVSFDQIYIGLSLEGNDAIRIPEIFAFTFADAPDLSGTVTIELSDFDGDTVQDTINWGIDGDGDGDPVFT